MDAKIFFLEPSSIVQKQYEALRMYFLEGKTAKETALKFGYKYRGFTTVKSGLETKISLIYKVLQDSFFLQKNSKPPINRSFMEAK